MFVGIIIRRYLSMISDMDKVVGHDQANVGLLAKEFGKNVTHVRILRRTWSFVALESVVILSTSESLVSSHPS